MTALRFDLQDTDVAGRDQGVVVRGGKRVGCSEISPEPLL